MYISSVSGYLVSFISVPIPASLLFIALIRDPPHECCRRLFICLMSNRRAPSDYKLMTYIALQP